MMPRDPQVRQHTSPSLYPSSNPSVHFFASLQPSTVDGRTLFKLRTKLLIILYLCKLYTFFLVFFRVRLFGVVDDRGDRGERGIVGL